jgi:hypothetical protein
MVVHQLHPNSRLQYETGPERSCDAQMVGFPGRGYHSAQGEELASSGHLRRLRVFFVPDGLLLTSCSWDLGGQPRFRSMWERYCRGVNAIV